MSRPCVYAPGPWGDCLDLGCAAQGGRCQYVGPPGRNACHCVAAGPSPSRAFFPKDQPMETALATYKRIITEQPAIDDAWFAETLTRAKAGDHNARQKIAGSCLSAALSAAEARWNRHDEDD